MKSQIVSFAASCLLACNCTFAQPQDDSTASWKPVEAALGRSGQMQPGEVYKFALPRRDMKVVKDGVTVAPGLALGSWVAFKKMGNEAMVMGDLVLTEEEIEPVMLKLQQQGIEQTSIHNHLLGESPRVIYMHIAGHGDPVVLARSLAAAIALTKTPAPAATTPATTPQAIDLQTPQVEQAIGYSGKVNGGILQFSVPRVEKITDSGMEVPPAMGTATAINFQPTGQGKAAISGDFVLLAKEVNPVIRALRTHGIEVEAMHNHMLFDQPHLYFMHFWANDDAVKLAQGLRAALDETNSQKPQVK
ncbi:DUF1259 domain-containing protein [Edaphobacter modestus]|uniref:Uncharacterized protein DUF1259 n=1 Tax=Edaphobacter modestus TaxID=388466 RepID=A0A4Q7YWM1_9BACT|nr:DUF1259 domain-containing protein [Edaphobacter modestus]RZU41485.1 uncharacterized protein DUF1259 [Edaphobacter modestus]